MKGDEDACAVKYGAILEELRDASFAAEGPSVRRLARMWSDLTGLSIDWDTAVLMLIQQSLVEDASRSGSSHLVEIANLAILLAADRRVRDAALFGALDAVFGAKAAEPEAGPAETVGVGRPSDWSGFVSQSATAALTSADRRIILDPGNIWPDGKLHMKDGSIVDPADLQLEASSAKEPILIEDDDAPAEGGGVPPEPEPVAEAVAEPEVAQAEPGAEVAPEPEAAQVEAEVQPEPEPEPEPLESRMAGTMADVLTEAMARRASEPAPVEPEEEEEGQPPAAGVWRAQDDLELAMLIVEGKGIKHAAAKMRRDQADCVKRFKELLPRPGIVAQASLVKRLKARVAAEGPDVA